MRVAGWLGLAATLVALLAPGVSNASRAEIEGMGLPRFLVIDPSNARLFPGTLGHLKPGVYLDYSRDQGTYRFFLTGYRFITVSDRFAMALFGNSLKYGYVLDGISHNLILASRGWGLSLGFADEYFKDEDTRVDEVFGGPDQIFQRTNERSEREVRLGFGLSSESSSERVFELGLGATYLDTNLDQFERTVVDTVVTTLMSQIHSDPGYNFELYVRSVSPHAGIQFAGSFFYEDLNPDEAVPHGMTPITRGGSASIGWRLKNTNLDNLILGWTTTWRKGVDPSSLSSSSSSYSGNKFTAEKITEIVGGFFVSGEHRLLDNLVARGGLNGFWEFLEEERTRITFDPVTGILDERELIRDSAGSIRSPTFFLGASWSHKQLTVDARVGESISLTSPFVRWAATVTF